MAQSLNDKLLDWAVSHQLDLQHYGNGVVQRMLALLNRVDPDLMVQLQEALERIPADSFSVQRLDSLLASVRELNGKAYEQFTAGLGAELKSLTDYEAGYQYQLFDDLLPARISIASVAVDQVHAAAMARPFQGRLLKEWAGSLESGRMQRIRDAVRIGFVENQTVAQIVQRIRGSRALGYADGLLQIDRRHAEAVVRTAIQHTANYARDSFYSSNAELIKGLRWVATLDSRTSPICRARDGKVYSLKNGPRPPAHWNCRSTMVPVIKSWRELGFDIDETPPGTRASMDGQVPGDLTYDAWLRKQPASVQVDILGNTKARLFRDGGLRIDRFVDRFGHEYTIDQLKARNKAAFVRAGLEGREPRMVMSVRSSEPMTSSKA
jgi:SPP1 gp7 family putative phage head morphogenesis protein